MEKIKTFAQNLRETIGTFLDKAFPFYVTSIATPLLSLIGGVFAYMYCPSILLLLPAVMAFAIARLILLTDKVKEAAFYDSRWHDSWDHEDVLAYLSRYAARRLKVPFLKLAIALASWGCDTETFTSLVALRKFLFERNLSEEFYRLDEAESDGSDNTAE